jgi:hypothetical protein
VDIFWEGYSNIKWLDTIRQSDAVVDDVSENPPLVLPLKNASCMLCSRIGAATHTRYVKATLIEEAWRAGANEVDHIDTLLEAKEATKEGVGL